MVRGEENTVRTFVFLCRSKAFSALSNLVWLRAEAVLRRLDHRTPEAPFDLNCYFED